MIDSTSSLIKESGRDLQITKPHCHAMMANRIADVENPLYDPTCVAHPGLHHLGAQIPHH